MDLQIRLADPQLMASERALEGLVEEIGHSAFLLTAFHDAVSRASGSAARWSSPN